MSAQDPNDMLLARIESSCLGFAGLERDHEAQDIPAHAPGLEPGLCDGSAGDVDHAATIQLSIRDIDVPKTVSFGRYQTTYVYSIVFGFVMIGIMASTSSILVVRMRRRSVSKTRLGGASRIGSPGSSMISSVEYVSLMIVSLDGSGNTGGIQSGMV